MTYGSLMVGCVQPALGIAEKGKFAGAAVGEGSSGEFVLRGSAKVIRSDNHHAKDVAITLAGSQTGFQNSGGGRWFGGTTEFGEGFREAGIGLAIGFDGGGDGLEIGEGVLFIAADGCLVPLDFE